MTLRTNDSLQTQRTALFTSADLANELLAMGAPAPVKGTAFVRRFCEVPEEQPRAVSPASGDNSASSS